MARRKGDIWWGAAMANNEGGHQEMPPDFLEAGRRYIAEIYTDGGEKIKTRTHVKNRAQKKVKSNDTAFRPAPRGRRSREIHSRRLSGNKPAGYYRLKSKTSFLDMTRLFLPILMMLAAARFDECCGKGLYVSDPANLKGKEYTNPIIHADYSDPRRRSRTRRQDIL